VSLKYRRDCTMVHARRWRLRGYGVSKARRHHSVRVEGIVFYHLSKN